MVTQNNSENFTHVLISSLVAWVPLPADVFLLINGKYVKYRNVGDELEADKINLFLAKDLKTIFVRSADFEKFGELFSRKRQESIEEKVKEVGEPARKVIEKQIELRDKLFDVFSEQELSSANVNMLKSMSKNFLDELTTKPNIAQLVDKLQILGEIAVDHALNVGNIAVFLAMVKGMGDKDFLESLYLASILHDIGKAKIPPNVLENPKSHAYMTAIQDHPTKSASILRKIKGIPDTVFEAVEGHHENFNGRGYPKNLSGDGISIMAKILSVANVYDNILIENKLKPKDEAHKLAIKYVEYDRGKQFDPQILPRIITGLKLAFGNYYK